MPFPLDRAPLISIKYDISRKTLQCRHCRHYEDAYSQQLDYRIGQAILAVRFARRL